VAISAPLPGSLAHRGPAVAPIGWGCQQRERGALDGIRNRRHPDFILLVTLGIITIRKGHWVMFIIGIFIPLFWIIGALMPPRQPA
jgi:hypothetical protein